jgi:hypothetical protein
MGIYSNAKDDSASFSYEADYWCKAYWKSYFMNVSLLRLLEIYFK